MSSTPSDGRGIDAVLAAPAERCLDLINGEEPRDLELLRDLREAFTDLYAGLISLPVLRIYRAGTWITGPTSPERDAIRNQLIQRLPAELY